MVWWLEVVEFDVAIIEVEGLVVRAWKQVGRIVDRRMVLVDSSQMNGARIPGSIDWQRVG
jgi:hypothetical protein